MAQIIKKIVIKLPLNFNLLAALFILADFGQEKYPGLGSAAISFVTAEPPANQMAEQQNQGVLFLGFTPGVNLPERLTEILGITNEPVMAKLKELTNEQSTEFKMFSLLISRHATQPDKLILVVLPLLKNSLASSGNESVWSAEKIRLLQENKIHSFTCFQGKKLIQAVVVESEVPEFDLWLTSVPQQVDLVLQKFQPGVKISARLEKKIELDNLSALLRIEEARYKRVPFDSLPKMKLFEAGAIEPVLEWHYDKSAQQILSGDWGLIKTPVTRLSFLELQELIKVGLNPILAQEKYPKFFN